MRRVLAVAFLFLAAGLAHAQAGSGFAKLNTTTATTYADTTVLRDAGQNFYQYQVTAFCAPPVAPATIGPCGTNVNGQAILGESTPLTTALLQEPGAGGTSPSITLNWIASLTPGVTYIVYRSQAVPPNAPTGITDVVN